GAGAGEAPHRHAADAVGPFRVLVLPRDVVARARRQHFDLVLLGEPLGDKAAVVLGSAEDFRAVTLDDEGESHWMIRGPLSPGLESMNERCEVARHARVAEVGEPAALAGEHAGPKVVVEG